MPTDAALEAEAIRLVIWDLDETFWQGTLTEGGVTWRPEAAETVRELARRGIISSICSKNDPGPVEQVLTEHGLREHFVFADISWSPKGPRLARLIEAVQLRPATVLFIDDNPMNRAEAQHFVPGLQVADEHIVPTLLDDPRLRGKADPDLTRLKQYQLLERRAREQNEAGDDTESFLRSSNITVTIEHDLEPHLDRAVELINRTNQLNFTKDRLPEEPEAARAALRSLLAEHNVQAGILRVRDNYGDYGYCGLYIMRSQRMIDRKLLHFAFSCRILGMGIETWLYRRLERPKLLIVEPVLTDLSNDGRAIDWIQISVADIPEALRNEEACIDYVLARGACDMRAISHYFGMTAGRVVEEFDTVRNGFKCIVNHSILVSQSIKAGGGGLPEPFLQASARFGYAREDFSSLITAPPAASRAVWLLSFVMEAGVPLFRHRLTGHLLPLEFSGLRVPSARILRVSASESGLDPSLLDHLRAQFEFAGLMTDSMFTEALRAILTRAGPEVRVFIVLANDPLDGDKSEKIANDRPSLRNQLIARIAAEFPNVELIAPRQFMTAEEVSTQSRRHHFPRMVYFRIFKHISARLADQAAAAA